MRDELFDELLESVRQAGAIHRGRARPSRSFRIEEPDVVAIRERYGLSQEKFAAMIGISVGTLRNWEQGRRKPEGPAKMLLRVAEAHPSAVLETTLAGVKSRRAEKATAAPQRARKRPGASTK